MKVRVIQVHQETDDASVLEKMWDKIYYILLDLTMVLIEPEDVNKAYMSKGINGIKLNGKELEVKAGGCIYEMEILEV